MKQFAVLLTLLGCLLSQSTAQTKVALSVSQDGSVLAATGLQTALAALLNVAPASEFSTLNGLMTSLISAQTDADISEICDNYGADTLTKVKNSLTTNYEPTYSEPIWAQMTTYIANAQVAQAILDLGECKANGLSDIYLDGTATLDISYTSVFNWDIGIPLGLSGLNFECGFTLDINSINRAGSITAKFTDDIKILHSSHIELIPGVLHEESWSSTVSDIEVTVTATGVEQRYASMVKNLANIALSSDVDRYVNIVGNTVTEVMQWPY